jgi:hypothetical protein
MEFVAYHVRLMIKTFFTIIKYNSSSTSFGMWFDLNSVKSHEAKNLII